MYDVEVHAQALCMRLRFCFGTHDTLSGKPDRSHGNARVLGNFGIGLLPVDDAPVDLAAKSWNVRGQCPVPELFAAFLHQNAPVVSTLWGATAVSKKAQIFRAADFADVQVLSGLFALNTPLGIDFFLVCLIFRLLLAFILFSQGYGGTFRAIALCAAHDGIGLAAHLAEIKFADLTRLSLIFPHGTFFSVRFFPKFSAFRAVLCVRATIKCTVTFLAGTSEQHIFSKTIQITLLL